MTTLAVLLCALGACGYAVGARLQHSAVQDMIGDGGLKLRDQLRLPRNPRWSIGLLALAVGAVLHASALGLAPLSVVQPVGVLALPITVLLNARQRGTAVRDLNVNAVLAVCAATGGVAAFVVGFGLMWAQNSESAVIMSAAPKEMVGSVGAVKPAVGQLGMGLGLGIHGEPGVSEVDMPSAAELARTLVDGVLAEEPVFSGTPRVAAILNGLGATKYEELFVVWKTAAQLLADAGIEVVEPEVGELVTSLDI